VAKTARPKYAKLMRYINKLPKHLLSMGGILNVNTRTNSAAPRHFRKHTSPPLLYEFI
jgi:hypothetical protein